MKALIKIIALSALAAVLGACNDSDAGDQVSVDVIGPGSECVHGGMRITVNDESHLTCNGDPSTSTTSESVAFGVDGNPCRTSAVRITIHSAGADAVQAWVCQEFDDSIVTESVEPFVRFLRTLYRAELMPTEAALACEDDPNKPSAIVMTQLLEDYYVSIDAYSRCMVRYFDHPFFSDEFRHYISCSAESYERHFACTMPEVDANGDPFDYCAEDDSDVVNAAVRACRDALVPSPGCENVDPDDFEDESAIFQALASNIGSVVCGAYLPEGGFF